MGAKTWMLVSSEGNARELLAAKPPLDREASVALARRLFPTTKFTEGKDGSISYTNPPDNEIFVGHFGAVAVVAAAEFGIDYPSQLPKHFLENMPHPFVVLHAMHSVVDWFAFAVWEKGNLKRALSLSPDSGIMEDIGEHYAFEGPYWNGEHGVADEDDDEDEDEDEEEEEEDKYPFVFHPLDLAEEALAAFFGYVIEGALSNQLYDPEEVPLMTLKRK